MSESTHGKDASRRVIVLSWLTLIMVGAIQTWVTRQAMSGDGVSYLDIGDAYFSGDWHNAINAMWSPLYSWLTGFALWIVKPRAYWEYPLVHFVHFCTYLGALAAYEVFLSQFIRTSSSRFPPWALRLLGYALFGWSSLVVILITNITADYLTAIAVYLAFAILLQIRRAGSTWSSFALLGGVLGLGYLAKAPMFLFAFVFLAAAFFSVRNFKVAIPRALLALFVFSLITGPFIVALSRHQGRPTFGESGKLNYVWWVNGINPRHWQGGTQGHGWPLHPTRQIYKSPAVFEFSSFTGGTYPPWYDPSYWYEGVKPQFSVRQQVRAVLLNLRVMSNELLLDLPGALICSCLFLLFYTSYPRGLAFRNLTEYLPLLIPALAALCLFLFVHFEGRYVAPFVGVALMCMFIGTSPKDRALFNGGIIVLLAALAVSIGLTTRNYLTGSKRDQRNAYWKVAQGLEHIGLKDGDKIATTTSGITNAEWARLARVRIVAEVFSNKNDEFWDARRDDFWLASPLIRQEIMEALAQSGVKALVTKDIPETTDTSGWQKVGQTDYYVHFVSR